MNKENSLTSSNKTQKPATRAKNKYNKNNYDAIYVRFYKGEKSKIEEAARNAGESINNYIVTAVHEYMQQKQKENKIGE